MRRKVRDTVSFHDTGDLFHPKMGLRKSIISWNCTRDFMYICICAFLWSKVLGFDLQCQLGSVIPKQLKHCSGRFLSFASTITIIFRPIQQRPTVDISTIPWQDVHNWQQEDKGNGSVGRKRAGVATRLDKKPFLDWPVFRNYTSQVPPVACLF